MNQRKAVILFGHGSRDPLWRQPIEAVAARLARAQPGVPVRCAYLELEQPDLARGRRRLVAAGATDGHRRADVPGHRQTCARRPARLLERCGTRIRACEFTLQAAVGEDPRVLDLLAAIALE